MVKSGDMGLELPPKRRSRLALAENRSALLLGGALMLLFVAAGLSYRSSVEVREAAARVDTAFHIRRQAQVILISITDAETGQRGYLLTGDIEYLRPYERAVGSLPDTLRLLRTLPGVSREQRRRVEQMHQLVDQKLAELRATVVARQTSGIDAALRIVRTGEGQALMNEIRAIVGAIIAEQSRELEQRQTQVVRRTREATYITVGALALAIAATSIATIIMLRNVRTRERQQADRQIEEQRARLAAIVEDSDDAVVGKDLDGVVTSWNPAAERIFGYPADEMIGRPITMIIPADRHQEETDVLGRLRLGEHIGHFDTIRRRKDGRLIDVSVTISPIRNTSGDVVGASKIARDITERKRMDAELKSLTEHLEARVAERTRQLEDINAELDAFGYTVSHDLRAPLRAMDGFAKALSADYADKLGARGRDYAQRIVDASERMDGLIQDLLAYSRLSRDELRTEAVDLRAVVTDAVRGLELEAQKRSAVIDVVEPLGQVLADRAALRQVVTNLLSNAIKFSAPGVMPKVRVWSEGRGRVSRVWVEDNGIGIDPRYHGRIFRVFERLHGVETYPGTGIGLAIVRRGAERMGGRVGVESAVGAGARFWVELPVVGGENGA
jgi:PAS domain S-box-containing protein